MTKIKICVCLWVRLFVGARALRQTPRPELEESPLIYFREQPKTEEEPCRDVTPTLPPSLNLHFLWVLTECMCVCARAIEQFTKAESRGHTSIP